MPLKRDPQGGGTEADGSKSGMYCSFCYEGGAFTQPDMTAEEMQQFVFNKLREMKFPKLMARMFSKGVPKLKRWNS